MKVFIRTIYAVKNSAVQLAHMCIRIHIIVIRINFIISRCSEDVAHIEINANGETLRKKMIACCVINMTNCKDPKVT